MNHVVIIDDAPLNIRIYTQILRALPDVAVESFTSSAEALSWCAGRAVDLLVVDYNMPAPNGLETVAAFRAMQESQDVPIIMITALDDRTLRLRALDLGVDEFLNKPPDPAEVVVRTRNLLALRARNQEMAGRQAWLAAEVKSATAEISQREQETIHRLMRAAEYRDNETGNHIIRMAHYSAIVAGTLGRSSEECELIRKAAPMHDIGKVAIPDSILLKNGPLTPAEWDIMKGHALAGYEILAGSRSELIRKAAEIALTHHEKFDGSGYPSGLSGETIPLSGRLCALADVFDALLSNRPYKRAWPLEDAIALIATQRGLHFDPLVVDAFMESLVEIQAVRERFRDDSAAA